MEEMEMKKIHLFIVTLITCSLITLFVACEKDEEIDLTTISVSNEQFTPSYTSATLQCSFATKATLRNVYVQYATTQDFVEYDEMEMSKSDDVYSVVLDSLQDNTTYYVRYAVSNRYSSAMIEEISIFQTLQPSVPTITLKSISDIWDTHAKAQIALEFDGGSQISEMGICWNTQPSPVVENNKRTTKDTVVSLEIKDLHPNTQYFVRAYAINKAGVSYSEEYEFTTFSLPEVKTEEIAEIQFVSALLKGKLLFNGNDLVTSKGFCWGEKSESTIDDDFIAIDTLSDTFTYFLSNLKDETQYYVRAYAQNKIGVVYGEEITFITQTSLLPVVVTSQAYDIDYQSASVNCAVNFDGGTSVMERGVVYSISQNPITSDMKVSNNGWNDSYTCNLTNLQENTTYYVRAYAKNRKGTAYGNQISFTTNSKSNGHAYEDLGLSGKWAITNVGASTPEGYGYYFRWGEVYPTWHNEGWDDYAHYNDSTLSLTKYTDGGDNKTQLELSDDAARVNWGGAWRIPSLDEWRELCYCRWEWTTQNGVKGYKVTSKINGNSIFLPAAGGYNGSSHYFEGGRGYYWSSSIYTGISGWHRAWHLYFGSGDIGTNEEYRIQGLSVRPVFQ